MLIRIKVLKDFDEFTYLTRILETTDLYNGNSKGSNINYTDMYRIADNPEKI